MAALDSQPTNYPEPPTSPLVESEPAEGASEGGPEGGVDATPGPQKSASTARFFLYAGTGAALLVSITAAVFAGFGAYVLTTPGHEKGRRVFERVLGHPVSREPAIEARALPPAASAEARAVPLPTASATARSLSRAPSDSASADSASAPETNAGVKRAPPKNPWVSTPAAIARLLPKANRARGLDKREMLLVHAYNAKHLTDPRGHLLLARSYTSRRWFKDALNEYAIALEITDGSARGDPRMLRDLIAMVGFGSNEASKMVVREFGEAAAPAIKKALAGKLPNPEAKELLDKLRKEVSAG